MKKRLLLLLILPLLLLTGCSNSTNYKGVVNVLNWSSYIPENVIRDFEKEYNIKVNYGTYSSNEELLAKVTSSKKGTYDVVFPSDYMVELMIDKKLVQKLDKSKLSNFKNINELFLNQSYDPNNKYSVPFLSTIVVIAYNSDKVEKITGYDDLLSKEHNNNIVMLDDQRIVIGLALMSMGHEMNETNPEALEEAKLWLEALKPNIKAYDSDSPKTFFITDEVDIGVMWSAEAILAKEKNPNIRIVYPAEGHGISTDNYVILDGAKNKENAYLFIDYLMKNNVSQKIVDEYPYISPNKNIESSISLNQVFNNGNYVKNIGSNIKKYDKLWADIK